MNDKPIFAPRNSIDELIAKKLLDTWNRLQHRWSARVRAEFKKLTPIARVTKGTCFPSTHQIIRKCMKDNPYPPWAAFIILQAMFGLRSLMGFPWWAEFRKRYPEAHLYDDPGVVPPNVREILVREENNKRDTVCGDGREHKSDRQAGRAGSSAKTLRHKAWRRKAAQRQEMIVKQELMDIVSISSRASTPSAHPQQSSVQAGPVNMNSGGSQPAPIHTSVRQPPTGLSIHRQTPSRPSNAEPANIFNTPTRPVHGNHMAAASPRLFSSPMRERPSGSHRHSLPLRPQDGCPGQYQPRHSQPNSENQNTPRPSGTQQPASVKNWSLSNTPATGSQGQVWDRLSKPQARPGDLTKELAAKMTEMEDMNKTQAERIKALERSNAEQVETNARQAEQIGLLLQRTQILAEFLDVTVPF